MSSQLAIIDLELRDADSVRSLTIRGQGTIHFSLMAPNNAPMWHDDDALALTIGRAVLVAVRERGRWR